MACTLVENSMKIPKNFQQNDETLIKAFIAEYPLGVLVCSTQSELEANHIPLYIVEGFDGNHLLKGHIARANPLWEKVEEGADVLVIFQGPQTYISPNWYPTKQEHGKVVPTWNYSTVHVNGEISFPTDKEWMLDMLNVLTNNMESAQKVPWQVPDAPDDYIQKMLNAIVGIEVEIKSWRSQWKMSQNQPEENQLGVLKGLESSEKFGSDSTLKFMKRIKAATNKA